MLSAQPPVTSHPWERSGIHLFKFGCRIHRKIDIVPRESERCNRVIRFEWLILGS